MSFDLFLFFPAIKSEHIHLYSQIHTQLHCTVYMYVYGPVSLTQYTAKQHVKSELAHILLIWGLRHGLYVADIKNDMVLHLFIGGARCQKHGDSVGN